MTLTCSRTSVTSSIPSETKGQSTTRRKSLAKGFTPHDLSGQPKTTGLTLSHPRDWNGIGVHDPRGKSSLTVHLASRSNTAFLAQVFHPFPGEIPCHSAPVAFRQAHPHR